MEPWNECYNCKNSGQMVGILTTFKKWKQQLALITHQIIIKSERHDNVIV